VVTAQRAHPVTVALAELAATAIGLCLALVSMVALAVMAVLAVAVA